MSAADDVKTFIKAVVAPLCVNPEAILVEGDVDEKGVLIRLYVLNSDMGRVIGKAGATSTAIRTLLHAYGARSNSRYSIKIDTVENYSGTTA